MSMTPKEAISYIENYGWSTTRLGLERTKELLTRLGDPQKKLKFIHVAGSNGKGSTCAMLAAILTSADYKTGLYISPYIEVFNERIQIDGKYISGDRLAEITERVMNIADAMADHPSQFELVTAIAIQYYYEEKCDIVVLEVGMGGALDSTNAIDAPEVAVITNIGLEHTEYLGNNLEEIAETKAGIIKNDGSCVCYDGDSRVTGIIQRICKERNVPFTLADKRSIRPVSSDLNGQRFIYDNIFSMDTQEKIGQSFPDPVGYNLNLLGGHQLNNAAVVLTVIESLIDRGWDIPVDSIKAGLETVKWPARFEVLRKEPPFILDGGHNPQCAEALVESIKEYLPGEKIVFLLGVLKDKDYGSIVDMMLPYAQEFICVAPLSERALPAPELADYILSKGGNAIFSTSIFNGIKLAEKNSNGNPIIGFGSLYLAGAVRSIYRQNLKADIRSEAIKKRNELTEEERIDKSKEIVERIKSLPEYQDARVILSYKWTKGEVKLDYFDDLEKTFAYPLCVDQGKMIAVKPGEGEDAWESGFFGIQEPVLELGEEIKPEDIDLVICPMTAFDKNGNRLGMGGGFYDRYLPKCVNAKIIAVAFDVQEVEEVPADSYDYKPDRIITNI